MPNSREKFGLALGFAGMALFAGTLPATRLAVATIDPLFLTAARAPIAGGAGLALLLATRRAWPTRAQWGELALAGLCTIVGFPVLMALAMVSVPAAHGGVVLGILPLATAAAAALIAHERPSEGFWLASAAGAGVVVLFVLSRREAGNFAPGDLFLVGTVIAGAFGYTLSGRLSLYLPGWEVISWQVALFLPLSVLATLALWPHGLVKVP
jgi:drug/metabolite transporter (DMT)-like permease